MTAPAHEKLREDARFNAAMFDNQKWVVGQFGEQFSYN